jgi:phosphoglycolate phosphatase-like HAD superfamily hydrolase
MISPVATVGAPGRGGLGLPCPAMDTILFDLDGTITDSARGIVDCFRHALAVVGAPSPDAEVLRGVVGPPIVHTFRRLGLDEADVRRARAAYRERYEAQGWAQNAVYPGMPELLQRLAGSGITLGVATSKNERMARQILGHFDLAEPFAFIGGASDDDSRIEKADVIAHTLRGLGRTPLPPEQGGTPGGVLVGDRSHDVQGAARFGIPTVLVTWGYGTPDEHRTARWSVSTPEQLGDLLDRLTAGSTAA